MSRYRCCAALLLLLALAGCKMPGTRHAADGIDAPPPALPPMAAQSETRDGPRTAWASQTPAAPQAPQVDFYVGLSRAAQGLVAVSTSAGPLWLYPQAILQRSDLTRAAAVRTPDGKHFVEFGLTELGAQKLAKISTDNVGALLVLVMQDKVEHYARIDGPMTQAKLYMPVPDDKTAQQILRQIKG